MKIGQLVKILQYIQKKKGDLEVFLSSDPEGNTYGDLGENSQDSVYFDDKKVILYPFNEGLELETE